MSQRQASCEGKARLSRADATKRRKVLQSKAHAEFSAYRCKYCGGWHIGRKDFLK